MRHLAFALILLACPAAAQSPAAPSDAVPVAGARLYQVTEGVFTLEEGQSIDLTDEHLLLTLVRGKEGCIAVRMNRGTGCVAQGDRLNLKSLGNGPYYIRGMFEDKKTCFLDVFNLQNLKGSKATADFRLLCS
ncbi:hypothetical protein [Mangrovicoccus ximenensis]|uniref:hypothetical protein n=1 Tax=Mangrovicoccus ximenensis TaxID=1911570 RepID=UPI000D3A2215|nr:hypothetical protein [Mangrovicoccus ximenensis]